MGGHAKCLLLMTRGEGGGSKIPKTCLRNTWMFPYNEAKLFNMLPPQMSETKDPNNFKTMMKNWIWDNIPSY